MGVNRRTSRECHDDVVQEAGADTVQPCSGMGIVSVFRSERKHATVANSIVEPEGRQTR